MKFEVTQKGVFDAKGNEVEIGTEIEVKGETVPGYLVGKGNVIKSKAKVTNPAKDAAKETEPKTAVNVLAMAEEAPFMTFKAEARKVLGDACPATKDEIIAALKAKAE